MKCIERIFARRDWGMDDDYPGYLVGLRTHHLRAIVFDGCPRLKTLDRLAKAWNVSPVHLVEPLRRDESLRPYKPIQLYQRVTEILGDRGLSQADLARAMGVSRQAVNVILNRANPRWGILHRLATGLGCTVGDLVS